MSGTTSVFDQPLNGDIDDVAEGLVILIDGDTAPRAITSGQYLFIKNHSTLATGGYHATAAITSGASITSSNVAADANGIVNALDGKVSALNSNLTPVSETIDVMSGNTVAYVMQRIGKIVHLQIDVTAFSGTVTFALPNSGRPIDNEYYPMMVNGTPNGYLYIRTNGNCTVNTTGRCALTYFAL